MLQRDKARAKAQALVAQMTVEEAASQLRYDAPAIDRLGIDEYNWWNEGLHGVARAGTATSFPQAIGLGATFDVELLNTVADVISTEGRAKYNEYSKRGDRDIYKGLTYWSPNVNIFRDPRWGRGHETYGEDPFLTGELGVSFIKGLQGEGDGVDTMKLAACAKHYAAHSGPEGLRHSFDAIVSDKDMWETYLPAFEACVKEGNVESVMGAYNRTNGEPCCAHSVLIGEILRGKWAFKGHFVSDCWAIRDFHENHKVTNTMAESAALALKMGCDVNCGCAYQSVMEAYLTGELDESYIRESAVKLFTTRYLLGMHESTPYDEITFKSVECKAHLDIAKKATEESLVLLKNNGLLPLDKSKVKTIGVVGPNANSRVALIGNYYGTSSRYVTVLEGIQNVAGDDVRVLYSEGCHLYMDKPDRLSRPYHRLAEAAMVADHSDVVVVCLGLDETLEGEEGDQGNIFASGDKLGLSLPEPQKKLLQVVIDSGKPFIVIMMAGSAIDMNLADEKASAILQAWYPGACGGQSVADVLFGLASPSGKLPVTLYRNLNDMPEFTDYSMKNRTYRHLSKAPLYPFGYGLTYGKAILKDAQCDASYEQAKLKGVTVTATVVNTSDADLCEVAQVYIKIKDSQTEVKNHRLCAFARVPLMARETKTITLTVPAKAFSTVDESGACVQDGTGAVLSVGFSQPDARSLELTGNDCTILSI